MQLGTSVSSALTGGNTLTKMNTQSLDSKKLIATRKLAKKSNR